MPRSYTHEQMKDLIQDGFEQAEQEIFNSLRHKTTEERVAVLTTLDALSVVRKQLRILIDREETSQ